MRSKIIVALLGLAGATIAHAETWKFQGVDEFYLPAGIYRSQGAAFDGSNWYFSYQYGLEKASTGFDSLIRNSDYYAGTPGIPLDIMAQGGNHIGDIDVANGIVYAPIEDGRGYEKPYIALFNASDLSYTGTKYLLPQSLQTAGVPWVAVDAAKGEAYTAEWNTATQINVFDLNDFSIKGSIALQAPIDRVQGMKVWNGAFYATSDIESKSVLRIDPVTGAVTNLFDLGMDDPSGYGALASREIEGMAFSNDANGEHMRVLMVYGKKGSDGSLNLDSSVRMRFYDYTLEPEALPEPGTWVLLATGFGLLGVVRRRSQAG